VPFLKVLLHHVGRSGFPLSKIKISRQTSLFAHFLQACECLNISYHENFLFSFWGCQPISLLELSRRDIKTVLRELARHQCYAIASKGARKDVFLSSGVLDFVTTTASREN